MKLNPTIPFFFYFFVENCQSPTQASSHIAVEHKYNTNTHVSSKVLLRPGHHCCDRMVVGFTTTYAISAYHH